VLSLNFSSKKIRVSDGFQANFCRARNGTMSWDTQIFGKNSKKIYNFF
jgi:hypothetical protein